MKKNGFLWFFRSYASPAIAVMVAACGGSAEVARWESVAEASVNDVAVTAAILGDQDNTAIASLDTSDIVPAVAAEASMLRIMAVGDSITHGVSGASSYRKPLIGLLQASGCDFEMVGSMTHNLPDTGFVSPHEAYSGHRTDSFLTGHQSSFGINEGISQSMMQFMPGLVLMKLGTNDIIQNRDVDNVIANIDQIVALIFDAVPEARVIIATLVPYFKSTDPDDDVNMRLEQFSNALDAWAVQAANPLVDLIDTREGFTADMMLPDLVHPDDSGDESIAAKFHQSISDNNLCG